MAKEITFDCSLGLEDVEKKLKKAEDLVDKLRDKIEASQKKQARLSDKMANASDSEQEKRYGGKFLTELEKEDDLMAELADAEANRAKWQREFERTEAAVAEQALKEQAEREAIARLEQEQLDKTKNIRAIQDAIQNATQGTSDIFAEMNKRVKGLVKRVLVFSVITKALRALRSYMSDVIKNNTEASQAIGRLKGAFQTLAAPLVQAVLPAVIALANWLTRIVTALAQFIGQLTGKGLQSMKNFAKTAKKGSSQFASFDTINQIGQEDQLQAQFDFAELTQQEMDGVLTTVGLIAAGIAAWKFPAEGLTFMENLAGWAMILGGAVLLVKNYFDAWANGINSNNLLGMLGGLAILCGGLFIIFGEMAAGIGLIVGGIALMVLGFKDIMENGVNLTNVLTVIAGIIATGLGIAILTGSFIPLLVAAIVGIVFALVAVGGQAEELVAGIKQIFGGLIKFVKGVFTGDWKLAWEGVKDVFKGIFNSILAIAGGVFNAIIKGINWVIDKINTIQFAMPDWVPVIGGKSVGFNIPHVSEWNVPYLANGAVIPPNREFLAVLGDQTNGTNIEAPLDTIVAAVQQALGSMPVNVDINYTGSLSQLGRVLQPHITAETRRIGSNLVQGV